MRSFVVCVNAPRFGQVGWAYISYGLPYGTYRMVRRPGALNQGAGAAGAFFINTY